jgi:regulator of cell morphogenesis and NO signaling
MASRVAQVHGAHASYLSRVEQIVKELSSDLALHMQKEERTLFPAIREVEAGVPPSLPVGDPIHAMEHEHDHAGARLAELRRITGNYLAPDWACQTFRALYHGLAELEAQMHVHVHLENNVLFPRAQQRSKASA